MNNLIVGALYIINTCQVSLSSLGELSALVSTIVSSEYVMKCCDYFLYQCYLSSVIFIVPLRVQTLLITTNSYRGRLHASLSETKLPAYEITDSSRNVWKVSDVSHGSESESVSLGKNLNPQFRYTSGL